MNKNDVLVIGRSCVDHISIVKEFPEEDKKAPLEFRLMEAGGQGSTASCCISKLGGRVAYAGTVGDDEEGKFCLKRLKDFNVKVDHVNIEKNGRTPIAYVFVTESTGKRTIIYERHALPKIELSDKIIDIIRKSNSILLDPETTYLAVKIKSINYKIPIIYDCERWRDGLPEVMENADYFIPSADFLSSKELCLNSISFNEKLFKLNQLIKGRLIVTNGQDGAYFILDERYYHVPAPELRVLDTIGAGDNFHAAFAFWISREKNIMKAVKFSVAVASLSCREYGGRNGIPKLDEAISVAEKLPVEEIKLYS